MNPKNASQGGDSPSSQNPQEVQSAAANVIRSQIDAMYGDQQVTSAPAPANQPQQQPVEHTSTYDRVHSAHPQPEAEQWKAYHSAWQNYYQQYYAAYYTQQNQAAGTSQQASDQQAQGYFSHTDAPETNEELSKDQALLELRQKLLGRVQIRAKKIRSSKHFMPFAAALVVILIFTFLQYNSVVIATVSAYVSPGAIDPQNIVVEPSQDVAVTADPRLIIPKINVDVPAIYGVGYDYDSQMAAMQKGVAHFAIPGANSHPGEIGNTVLSGHSSNDLFDKGDYKFIFAQLDKLNKGDTVYAHYESKRYTYVVTKKEVVKPNEVNKLVYATNKPLLTLITCTPLGTSKNRLLVTAEQVSPDPAAQAAPAGSGQTSGDAAAIPGDAPTLLERLFGAH